MPRLSLALNQKRFNSTSRVTGAAINMGATRGIGSTTRMFYYCRQHSANPADCINQFVNIQGPKTSTGWSTKEGKLLGAELYGEYTDYVAGLACDKNGNIYVGFTDNISGDTTVKKWNGTSWSTLPGVFDNEISSLAVDSNNNLYVGGYFSSVNTGSPLTVNQIAKWNGSSWSALGSGIVGTDGGINSIAIDSVNNVYVVGWFTDAGGLTVNQIAKYNPTSNSWSALGSGTVGTNNEINCIAIDSADNVYVGGFFSQAGGSTVNQIAKYNPNTNSWSALGSGCSGTVRAIAIDSDNQVYVGGSFEQAGGLTVNYIAKYIPTSNSWSSLGNGFNDRVMAIAIDSANNVYVGGEFVFNNDRTIPYYYVAKWDGSSWNKLNYGLSDYDTIGSSVVDYMVYCNNKIYMVGDYLYGSNVGPNYLLNRNFSVNTSSLSITPIGSAFEFNSAYIYAYAVDSVGNLYVGGYFIEFANGNPVNYIAKWTKATNTWSTLGSGCDGIVYSIAIDSNDDVYVGGGFGSAGSVANTNVLAKWSPNTSSWSAVGSGVPSASNEVFALAIDSLGNLYIGGYGFNIGGDPTTNYIAKWDGSTWSSLGTGLNNTVNAIAFDSNNNVYVGGLFTDAGGTSVNNIAKWTLNTSSWSALGTGTDNEVTSIAIDSLNNVYVGGYFNSAGGVANTKGIAKWNGSTWSALGTGIAGNDYDTDAEVYELAIDKINNNLYVGGYFLTAGSLTANNIAKWNGSAWVPFNVVVGSSVGTLYYNNQQLYIRADVMTNTDTSPGFIVWNI